MCDICEQYRLASLEEKKSLQTAYDEHIHNKTLVEKKKLLIK